MVASKELLMPNIAIPDTWGYPSPFRPKVLGNDSMQNDYYVRILIVKLIFYYFFFIASEEFMQKNVSLKNLGDWKNISG